MGEDSKEMKKNLSDKEKIELLRQLRDEGILTTAEYDKKIDDILENLEKTEGTFDVEKAISTVRNYENEISNMKENYDVDSVINSIKYYKSDKNKNNFTNNDIKKSIKIINWGLYLGIASIFLGSEMGMIPLLAIILSLYGFFHVENNNKYKKRSIIGIILGVIYFISYLYYYGYL